MMKKMLLMLTCLLALGLLTTTGQATPKTAANKAFDCRRTLDSKCEVCHYKTRICNQLGRKSLNKWRATIKRMVRHGAIIGKKEAEALAQCLDKSRPGADICLVTPTPAK